MRLVVCATVPKLVQVEVVAPRKAADGDEGAKAEGENDEPELLAPLGGGTAAACTLVLESHLRGLHGLRHRLRHWRRHQPGLRHGLRNGLSHGLRHGLSHLHGRCTTTKLARGHHGHQ